MSWRCCVSGCGSEGAGHVRILFDNSHPDWAPSLHVRNSYFDRVVQRNISRHSRRLERESRTLEQINAVVNNGKSAANRQDNDVPNAVVNNEHDHNEIPLVSDMLESGSNDFASEQVPNFFGVEISDECNNGVENQHEATGVYKILELMTTLAEFCRVGSRVEPVCFTRVKCDTGETHCYFAPVLF
ncbi:uncharacterized protein LOC123469853 [Daphnia magna]|uniref:uncharacterized protein LOC123469853 n=1 Tax=Daphnia magna TaxID=35525 RepID=UPI001E1BC165|nr:uncharacterized protein LOC123469853 [Daphnia magna]